MKKFNAIALAAGMAVTSLYVVVAPALAAQSGIQSCDATARTPYFSGNLVRARVGNPCHISSVGKITRQKVGPDKVIAKSTSYGVFRIGARATKNHKYQSHSYSSNGSTAHSATVKNRK